MLRDVFLRTIASAPGYAAYSFLVEQPRSILAIAFGRDFLRSRGLLVICLALALALGFALAAANTRMRPVTYVPALAAATLGSVLPALSAAAAELRTVEIFYMLLLDAVIIATILAALPGRVVLSRISRKESA